MFKKLTYLLDVGVRSRLETDMQLDRTAGYRRVVEMLSEFCRYAALTADYRPPSWINLSENKSLYKLMAPNEGWGEGNAFCRNFQAAYRIECILSMWTNERFRLKLTWFPRGRGEAIGFCEFTVGISDGNIDYCGGNC